MTKPPDLGPDATAAERDARMTAYLRHLRAEDAAADQARALKRLGIAFTPKETTR